MKHIACKSLLILLIFAGSHIVMATPETKTKKTALDYLLECPEYKDVSELLQEEATRGCCNSCNNCSSCSTCSSCCKKGESNIKRSSCCNKCNNCTSCKKCSSCCKNINLDDTEDALDEQMDDLEESETQNFAAVQALLETLEEQIEELQLNALANRKKVTKKSFPEASSRSLRK